MAFAFNPLSDEELLEAESERFNLLPDGDYRFIVKQVSAETSKKSGNAMLKLNLQVKSPNGKEGYVTDYLVNTKKMIFKLKHFLDSIGMPHLYTQGSFDHLTLVNKQGNVKITTEKGSQKDDGTFYPSKNAVKDYLKRGTPPQKVVVAPPKVNDDFDDVPF